jgi:hypothetical protein
VVFFWRVAILPFIALTAETSTRENASAIVFRRWNSACEAGP